MKKIFLFSILLFCAFSCNAQTYPLRTYGIEFPANSYLKDTNNELQYYEGTWKGTWNSKTIFIILKKITNKYDEDFKYYRDFLIAKFKVMDPNGLILFDNTLISDNKAKVQGGRFRKVDDKYSLWYVDSDICFITGDIYINFTDSTKTKLNWKFIDTTDIITPDCPYYDADPFPEPLPEEIVLTKQ